MKTLLKNSFKVFFFISLFLSNAQGAMEIKKVVGHAFSVKDSRTSMVGKGDHLTVGLELLTEGGALVELTDYYNRKFYLAGSTHIKLQKRRIQLLEGVIWFQGPTQKLKNEFKIETANAKTTFANSSGIISFDSHRGKSQFLSTDGFSSFANRTVAGPTIEVAEGMFTAIDNEKKQGTPRQPVPIGHARTKNCYFSLKELCRIT